MGFCLVQDNICKLHSEDGIRVQPFLKLTRLIVYHGHPLDLLSQMFVNTCEYLIYTYKCLCIDYYQYTNIYMYTLVSSLR